MVSAAMQTRGRVIGMKRITRVDVQANYSTLSYSVTKWNGVGMSVRPRQCAANQTRSAFRLSWRPERTASAYFSDDDVLN